MILESAVRDPELDDFIYRTELRILRSFMDRAEELRISDLPEPEDRLAWWELMQHHHAPTRLLDWTTSPFIALWFAISERTDHKDAAHKDAALWIFDKRSSFLNHQEIIQELDRRPLDARTWQNVLAQRAIDELSPAPVVVETRRQLARAAAQKSVVTLIPDPATSISLNSYLLQNLAVKIVIPDAWRRSISRALESMGVTRSNLMMDLDSTGVELSRTLGY